MPEKKRRNPLEPPDEEMSNTWQQFLSTLAGPERLEEPEPVKRKRDWDKAHPPRCYRGVPMEVRQQIREIAGDLSVPADEVARAFLEYGLQCVKNGTLILTGRISQKRVRLTLYPFTGAGWAENGWQPQPPKRRSGKKELPALWRESAFYRIPDAVHEQVKRLAGDMYSVGEVAAILLKHGIESYARGVLVLMPQPKFPAGLNWSGGQT